MEKLFLFQQKVGAIKKDSVNPFYKSKYADINSLLDMVKPVLNEVGLTAVQPLGIIDGKNVLHTKILDGDKVILESSIIIPDNLDPQKIGSAITYYRRYSLQALLLLEAEDDDAESTKPKKIEPKVSKPMERQQPDDAITKKINECKTEKELGELYSSLDPEEQPTYVEKFSNRKSILKANKR